MSSGPARITGGRPPSSARRRFAPSGWLHALLGRGIQGPPRDRLHELGCADAAPSPIPHGSDGHRARRAPSDNQRLHEQRTDIEEIERYWLDLLDLPATSARKHMTNICPPQAAAGRATSCRTGSARYESTAPGCSSTSMARFRSTQASTSRRGCTDVLPPRRAAIIRTGPLAQWQSAGLQKRSASRETASWSAAVCWDPLRASGTEA